MAEIGGRPSRAGLTAPARLEPSHDTGQFDCGTGPLDDWLRDHALGNEGQTARTYVVCHDNRVVGYYCISMGSVEHRQLPSKLKRRQGLPNHIPVAIIGRLARDKSPEWRGLGKDLVRDALSRIVSVSQTIGVRCVLVHAIDDAAALFWKGLEFQEYPGGSKIFFMAIETVLDSLG